MIKPVIVRLASQSGASVAGYAQRLGKNCSASDKPSGYQIRDGYILKAQRNLKGYTVTVLDTPLFLMLTGNTMTTGVTPPNASTPVGARDSFLYFPALATPPVTYEAVQDEGNFFVPWALPKVIVNAVYQMLVWAPVQWRGPIFCLGSKRLPFLSPQNSSNALWDNFYAFPFEQTVHLTCKMATFLTCSLPAGTINELRNNYLSLAHFDVSEDDLPGDWTHHPRRLVPRVSYDSSDSYARDRSSRAMWQFGVAWSPAGEMEAGADIFCMASEIYNQLRTTWTLNDGNEYNPPYYDREGEHALGVFIGRLARDAYDPDDAVPIYAELIDQYMVKAADLPVPDLRPFPADAAELYYGPSRPNWAYFIDPLILRSTEGFTAFCAYRHDRIDSDFHQTVMNKVRALLVVTPDRATHVLKADAWPSNRTYPAPSHEPVDMVLPGYDPVVRCNPWLVGGFTVDGVDSFDEVTHTAYALVYEHDDAQSVEVWEETGTFGQYIGTNYGQSKWALYTVESGPPTRTELTQVTPSASPVATLLTSQFGWPVSGSSPSNNIWAPFDHDLTKRLRLCNFAHAGNGLGVTASIDRPHYMTPPGGGWGGEEDLTPHDVKCAVVNLLDGTIEQRGTIFVRDKMWTWCFITVAQPYDPGDPDAGIPETQPVLIASTNDSINSVNPSGKCWMSVDGGWIWDEYVTDIGAQMGAHLVGNRLFEYDPLKPFL